MKIAVCIKQVPETTEVQMDPEKGTLIRDGVPSIINPFDLYAIEEALRVREKTKGKVFVLTMGPPQAKEALTEAVAMGADEAILISDRALAGSDTLATSYALAHAIKHLGDVQLIFCGKQAIDGDTAQVGPGIAEWLDIPFVAFVKKIEELTAEKIRVERMMETGYDVLELKLPALLTVVKEINEPRVPSIRGKMRAKRYEPEVWTAEQLQLDGTRIGLEGSPTWVMKIFHPQIKRKGEVLQGEPEDVVEQLIAKLKESGMVL